MDDNSRKLYGRLRAWHREHPAPKIEGARGLIWLPRKESWEARWCARTDLIQRGWKPKSLRLWRGEKPTTVQAAYIADICNRLQADMLVWGRGGIEAPRYDGTLHSLIACYKTDPDSPYRKLRFGTRKNYDYMLAKLDDDHGAERIENLKGRTFLRWHETWLDGSKLHMAHGMISKVRTLVNFGFTFLECEYCERVAGALHTMKFPMGKSRSSIVTADQVNDIRKLAHAKGLHSMALAQAFQFECMLRQRDVIGEWVPNSEDGVSEVTRGNEKWLRGLRWNEIDANLILRHVTSKRNKLLEADLKLAPMVMEELQLLGDRPASGAVVVFEHTGEPYSSSAFRHKWRELADECGIPRSVKNMDNRAGAISEATDAGAELEHVRHAATHSNIATTQGYSRGAAGKVATVMQLRAAKRTTNKTD